MKHAAYLLLFFTIILFSINAHAQTADTVKTSGWFKHNIAGAAQIQVTYRNTKIGQLNHALNANGIPSIGASDIWINASMNHVFNNWMLEDGIGFNPLETSTSANDIKAKYSQYQAFLRLGYNLSKNDNFRYFPFVGANFSASVLKIEDKGRENNTSDFSEELLNSTSSKTFWQPNFGIELGAGFDYLIKVKPKQMECFTVERSIPVGIREGYYFNTYAGNYKLDSHHLNNGPDEKQNAVFVSLNIGLGYKITKP